MMRIITTRIIRHLSARQDTISLNTLHNRHLLAQDSRSRQPDLHTHMPECTKSLTFTLNPIFLGSHSPMRHYLSKVLLVPMLHIFPPHNHSLRLKNLKTRPRPLISGSQAICLSAGPNASPRNQAASKTVGYPLKRGVTLYFSRVHASGLSSLTSLGLPRAGES
jgi:hypothetical protein